MGIHGNYGSTATATRNIESEGRGPDIAINEAGNITSGGARVSDGVAFAHDSKMEVYDNAGNHLGSSDVLENGVDATLGDVTFTFSTPIPVDNETVRAYVWGDNLGSGLNLAYDGGSGRNFQGLATYPTPPDPDGSGTDGRYYAVWVTVTPTASRSADSLTGAFRRGNTGVTVNCTGLDTAPTTQTVTVTDGTHSDTCTITNWNSGDPIINIDCALPPGAYDIQVTDDTGTVTLSGQTLLIETNWEEVVFDGNTPPANQESLSEGSLEDFPAIPEIVAGDSWGVQSHADVTWQANGSVIILPAGEHTLSYWFWDDSTGVMYSGETIVIGERPDLTSPTLTSAGQNTMQGTVDTDTDTGTLYAYWSTSATPPSATDLKAGTGAAWSGNQAITSTGTKTFNATGLVAGTTYYAHFLHDNSGSESDISTSAGVATDAGGGNQAPVINNQTFSVIAGPLSPEYISTSGMPVRAVDTNVTDFEGNTHLIPAGTPLREGCRVVENLCQAPSDITDSAFWINSNGAVILNTTQWQNDAVLNSSMRSVDLTGFSLGDQFRVHCKLAIADKSIATSWRLGFYQAGGGNGGWTDITSAITSDEQWITSNIGEITTLGTALYAVVHAISPSGVTTITQSEFFIERITGQAYNAPSTFTDDLAYSDYRNGNTIVANIVQSNLGAEITDAYWVDINTVQTSDPDEDPLTYSIVAGNTDNDLTIDPNTGVLSWANTPDITRTASYNLTVQVSDGTDTATATVTVNVVEAGSGVHRKLTLGIGIGGF